MVQISRNNKINAKTVFLLITFPAIVLMFCCISILFFTTNTFQDGDVCKRQFTNDLDMEIKYEFNLSSDHYMYLKYGSHGEWIKYTMPENEDMYQKDLLMNLNMKSSRYCTKLTFDQKGNNLVIGNYYYSYNSGKDVFTWEQIRDDVDIQKEIKNIKEKLDTSGMDIRIDFDNISIDGDNIIGSIAIFDWNETIKIKKDSNTNTTIFYGRKEDQYIAKVNVILNSVTKKWEIKSTEINNKYN
jgi:hypothetical protein